MLRRRRHIFTTLSTLSLLLAVAVVVLWVRSYSICDYVYGGFASCRVAAGESRGDFVVVRSSPSSRDMGYGREAVVDLKPFLVDTGTRGGFGFYIFTPEPSTTFWVVPLWFLTLASMFLPALWIIARLCRRRATQAGLCPACGYDLRATPDRCPECGKATPVPPPLIS